MYQQLAKQWLLLNEPYAANHANGVGKPNSVHATTRDLPLLLTAPHAVHHERRGKDKQSDARTGGLCELLGNEVNASTLIAAGFVEEWESWDKRDDNFKHIIENAVNKKMLVLDLHGLSNAHGVDICLGLGPQPSKKVKAIAAQLQHDLQPLIVSINTPFGAYSAYTVTSYVQSLGGDSLQIEIAARFRDPKRNTAQAGEFVHIMAKALRAIIGAH